MIIYYEKLSRQWQFEKVNKSIIKRSKKEKMKMKNEKRKEDENEEWKGE